MDRPAQRPVRVLLDGVGSRELSDDLLDGLRTAGRPPLQVHAEDFWRPAGERFAWGREDEQAFRSHWLDAAALDREVLSRPDAYLPALWDVAADRSARRRREPVPPGAVLLVDGVLLLDRGLPVELTVHLALSPAALGRRGVTLGLVGVFLVKAAVQFDPKQAKGLDAALQAVAEQPYGRILLGLTVIGVLAYALWSFFEAAFRKI